jgi:hypothetical protein
MATDLHRWNADVKRENPTAVAAALRAVRVLRATKAAIIPICENPCLSVATFAWPWRAVAITEALDATLISRRRNLFNLSICAAVPLPFARSAPRAYSVRWALRIPSRKPG